MIFDEIFDFMLWEHVKIVNFDNLVVKYCFDNGKILAYYDLWIEWYVLMLMIEWWSWCYTFGIMYELYLFVYIKYTTPMFNSDPLASLMI